MPLQGPVFPQWVSGSARFSGDAATGPGISTAGFLECAVQWGCHYEVRYFNSGYPVVRDSAEMPLQGPVFPRRVSLSVRCNGDAVTRSGFSKVGIRQCAVQRGCRYEVRYFHSGYPVVCGSAEMPLRGPVFPQWVSVSVRFSGDAATRFCISIVGIQ